SEAARQFFAAISGVIGGPTEGRAHLSRDVLEDPEVHHRLGKLDAALEALASAMRAKDAGDAREDIVAIGRRVQGIRDDLARVVAPDRDVVAWVDVRARSCAVGVSPIELAPVFRRELFDVDDE